MDERIKKYKDMQGKMSDVRDTSPKVRSLFETLDSTPDQRKKRNLLIHIGYALVRAGVRPTLLRIFLKHLKGIDTNSISTVRGYIETYDYMRLKEFYTDENISSMTPEQKSALLAVCDEVYNLSPEDWDKDDKRAADNAEGLFREFMIEKNRLEKKDDESDS